MSAVVNPLTSLISRLRLHHPEQSGWSSPVAAESAARQADRNRARWSAMTKELEEHASAGNWRSYRTARLHMANFLRQKGHLAQALELYLDVWYLDLNGPRDAHEAQRGSRGARLLNEDPLFEPGRTPVAGGVQNEVERLITSLALHTESVQTIFLHVAGVTHRKYALPLLPTRAWMLIGPKLLK